MLPDVRTMAKKFYGERRADLKFASVFVCYEPLWEFCTETCFSSGCGSCFRQAEPLDRSEDTGNA